MRQEPEEDVFHRRLDWGLWLQVLRRALPYKKFWIPLLATGVVLALVDSAFALVTRWAVDTALLAEDGINLWPQAITFFVLATTLSIGVFIFIKAAGGLSTHMSHDIRRDTFKRLQELELAYFDHRPTGWLISRLTSDCDRLARIIAWGTLDLLWAVCLVVAIGVILLVLNFQLGILILLVVPPLIFVSSYFQKVLLLSARETRKYNSMITASFNEGLQGMRTTKTLGREDENQGEFNKLSEKMLDASVRHAIQSAVFIPLVLVIGSVAAGIALWRGGVLVLDDQMTPGTLVAFIFYAGQFFNPINQIAMVLVRMQGAQAAGERVLNLLATEPGIHDSDAVRERLAAYTAEGLQPGQAPDGFDDKIRDLEFRGVHFSYIPDEPVIRDFNLRIQEGQLIALVGESGGGKSTLVNLAARFYEPTDGVILVNGQPLAERSLEWYHQQIAMVLQDPHLFSGTLRENIRYGRLDATDAEIEEVARQVNADGFIRNLPDGYESEVGEGGVLLSTGQKQLISLARALLANPQILIMDEATSSIDTETEQLIQDGLKTVFAGRISFVIAHRLSTIRNADQILVISKGSIIESGTHDALMAAEGQYYRLYTRMEV